MKILTVVGARPQFIKAAVVSRLQREAFFAGKQCVTVLDFVVWPETMVGNRNQLADHRGEDILKKLNAVQTIDPAYCPFGDGHAGERIVDLLI